MKIRTLMMLGIGASLGASAIASAAEGNAKPPKTPKHHLTFDQADVDDNDGLSLFEYATTAGQGTPLVQVRKRFLLIDTSGAFEPVLDPTTGEPVLDPVTGEPQQTAVPDGLVTRDELKAYRDLAEKPESELSRFQLADLDGDGFLTPVESSYLVSPRAKYKSIVRRFNRLDLNDDGFLSKSEFKKDKATDV